jgi:excisionase family DNA binding protein
MSTWSTFPPQKHAVPPVQRPTQGQMYPGGGAQGGAGGELSTFKGDLRPFFTTRSLAERLSLSDRTVRDLIGRGEIPSYKVSGARRIDPKDVDMWLAERRHGKERQNE